MRYAVIVSLVLLAMTTSGCQTNAVRADKFAHNPGFTNNWGNALLWYIPNRVMDLLDVVHAGYGIGPGFGAEVQVTRLFSVGAVGGSQVGIGWFGRYTSPFEAASYGRANLSELQVTTYEKNEPEPFDFGGSTVGVAYATSSFETLDYHVFPHERPESSIELSAVDEAPTHTGPESPVWRIPRWDVGIRYHALLDQVYVGVSVNEFADFVAGFFFYDLVDDDLGNVRGS